MLQTISSAIQHRINLFDPAGTNVFRIFNGFREGIRDLVLEIYASTLLINDSSPDPGLDTAFLEEIVQICRVHFPFLTSVIWKRRNSANVQEKRGIRLFGEDPAKEVTENGVSYAIDLQMNQDASFYIDTRNLRIWLKTHCEQKSVLNTFAYTGSLGIAALAGGASRVVQTDLNPKFLEMAQSSAAGNGFPARRQHIIAGDFFRVAAQTKRERHLFDLVIVDPPFFSLSDAARLSLETDSPRLINKIRPLVKDGGKIVFVNNSLFLSGRDFYGQMESLCADGYVTIEERIDVAADAAGFDRSIPLPSDPAPFNHATKIIVLGVKRKESL